MAIIDPGHAANQLIFERIFRSATFTAAILVLLILGGVAVSLLRGAWPALAHFRFAFITHEIWNPVTDQFGALAPIYGTVVSHEGRSWNREPVSGKSGRRLQGDHATPVRGAPSRRQRR